ASIGASVSLNEIGGRNGRTVSARIEDSAVSAAEGVSLSAKSTAGVHALAVGGSVATANGTGSQLAIAASGAYATNEIHSVVDAHISSGSSIQTTGQDAHVTLTAEDSARFIRADAYGVAAAFSGSSSAGSSVAASIGLGIAGITVSSEVLAYIDDASVKANGDVSITASAAPDVNALALGIALSIA